MTNWTEWFHRQLQASADGFEWGFLAIPEARRLELPPEPQVLGQWPPARHLWHVTEYERCLALPSMRQWLGGPQPGPGAWPDDDAAWRASAATPAAELLENFRAVRREQIALIGQLAGVDWDAPRQTGWGMLPLSWIVTKTFQHTHEHGDTLLRMGLWWDFILEQMALGRARQAEASA